MKLQEFKSFVSEAAGYISLAYMNLKYSALHCGRHVVSVGLCTCIPLQRDGWVIIKRKINVVTQ
jgi:intracellular sulfur oxidation DsrE/DsrF family protein